MLYPATVPLTNMSICVIGHVAGCTRVFNHSVGSTNMNFYELRKHPFQYGVIAS